MLFNSPYQQKKVLKGEKNYLLLHMEGCSHCAKLMPEWEKFTELNDTSITTRGC